LLSKTILETELQLSTQELSALLYSVAYHTLTFNIQGPTWISQQIHKFSTVVEKVKSDVLTHNLASLQKLPTWLLISLPSTQGCHLSCRLLNTKQWLPIPSVVWPWDWIKSIIMAWCATLPVPPKSFHPNHSTQDWQECLVENVCDSVVVCSNRHPYGPSNKPPHP
jgi:hypothetical protein